MIDNSVVVTNSPYVIGETTSSNVLIITNAAQLFVTNSSSGISSVIGNTADASNNTVILNGAVWTNQGAVYVGKQGEGNQLLIENGGALLSDGVVVGAVAIPYNLQRLSLTGGTSGLFVTNGAGTSVFDLRRGYYEQSGGTTMMDYLIATNAGSSAILLNYGQLSTLSGAVVESDESLNVGGTSGQTFRWNLGGDSNVFHLDSLSVGSANNATGRIVTVDSGHFTSFYVTNGLAIGTNGGYGVVNLGDMAGSNVVIGLQYAGSGMIGTEAQMAIGNGEFVVTNGNVVINTSGGARMVRVGENSTGTNGVYRQVGGTLVMSNVGLSVGYTSGGIGRTGLVSLVGVDEWLMTGS